MPKPRASVAGEAGGRVFGKGFQLRDHRLDEARKGLAGTLVNGRDGGGGLHREDGAEIGAEIRMEFQRAVQFIRLLRATFTDGRQEPQPQHLVLGALLTPDEHIGLRLRQPAPAACFGAGERFAKLAGLGKDLGVGEHAHAGLAAQRELLLQLGKDMPRLALIGVAVEFGHEDRELRAVRRARLAPRFGLEPPALPAAENENGDAYDDAGNNVSRNRRNIHDAPPMAQTRRQWARGDMLTSSFGLSDGAAKTGIGQGLWAGAGIKEPH